MHYISNKVISGVLLCDLGFLCQVLPKVDIPVHGKDKYDKVAFKRAHISSTFVLKVGEQRIRDGEVDDCRVLLHKEVVLGESFNAENEVRRQFGQLKPFEKILLVGFVFLRESEMHLDIFIFDAKFIPHQQYNFQALYHDTVGLSLHQNDCAPSLCCH